MDLTKHGFKDKKLVSFGGGTNREGGKEEKRKRKKKKRRRGRGDQASQGMELTLGMNSCMNFHTIAWLLAVPKPRVC